MRWALVLFLLAVPSGCSEATEKYIADAVGMEGGVCPEGDLEYWPPCCHPTTTGTAGL